ncbi:efflux RND transporter permease subunit [Tautonia sociabilis]|uniref:Efflux RND transporter permease subunit n=1 Tax=Tautonia sociabilis TaxID=2080755 RepID=A0A432ME80_9BACT|nr:efflux RND transporter permease subunit [Tautonia sociabilis]RUL83557.1 efflux RND transporter permease subunit [Tautonia sociabilis]
MIARIIELSIRNRFLVILLTGMLVGLGIWSVFHIRLDAIPDLSDVQVIVTTEYPGQNPQVVDDQVTYPLTTAMLAVPGSTVVRGFSMFEQSFVYVLFEDGTDIYWARSRVLEYLNFARDRLPKGVEPKLGPDATGVGWVYQYVLFPGYFSPDHPKGLWHDEAEDRWYASPAAAPEERRERLKRVRGFERPGSCPLTGKELVPAELDLAQLRSLQDWYLRYPLTSVEGVSEVASIGGFVRQYQVVLDPASLQAFKLPLRDVVAAIERSNNDVGGSVLELSENEYMVRSRGYLRGLDDLAQVPVGLGASGTPILLSDVATLQVGGEARRGIGEYNGIGEAVGAVIVARFGENAHKVIADAKEKLFELEGGLPPGVFVKPTYDRSELIQRSVRTLRNTLIEEIIVVGLVCILFLLHARSELVAVFVVPSSVIVAVLIMNLMGINANIMSLGGIALSIGVVVDSAIIMVENAHKHLDREEERLHAGHPPTPRVEVITAAATEVGPQLFFSLLIITVSFLPVFVLEGEAGRLFKPLAFTKTFAMAAASALSITIIPVLMFYFITARVLPERWGWGRNLAITAASMLMPAAALFLVAESLPQLSPFRWWIAAGWAVLAGMLLVPQRIIHEEKSPISKLLQRLYEPVFRLAMGNRALVLLVSVALLLSTIYPATRLGSEFMPPLDEGDLLYMPTTDPSISITKSKELLQQTNKLIATFPEVLTVHGKIGRAESATDPAPLSMIETVVQLKPEREQWRRRHVERFHSEWPDWLKQPFAALWPEERNITTEELKFGWRDPDGTMHPGLNTVVSLPGVANAWPFPIENRINMLATGIKTPVGIKILGPDLEALSELAQRAANAVRTIEGTISAYPDRTFGGYYLDVDVDRVAAARYGLTIGDVQDVVQSAIGGMNVTTTVEGLERYPLNVRYARELRDDIPALREVLVTGPTGVQVPLGQLAAFRINPGAPMIRSENAQRTAWVFVDIAGRDLGGYIEEAREAVAKEVPLPPGYSLHFSGQFEFWEKTLPRLVIASVITVLLIVLLLYASSRSWFRVGVIMLAVPFSLIGAFWFLYALDYNMSLAVVIGIIALAGLDAETGMVMLLYLDNSFERAREAGKMTGPEDLWAAVHDGAVKRIRPKAMTVSAAFIGLVPLLWAEGTGADVMRRLAAPMIGGLLVSFAMELIVYPVLFYTAREWQHRREWGAREQRGLNAALPSPKRG